MVQSSPQLYLEILEALSLCWVDRWATEEGLHELEGLRNTQHRWPSFHQEEVRGDVAGSSANIIILFVWKIFLLFISILLLNQVLTGCLVQIRLHRTCFLHSQEPMLGLLVLQVREQGSGDRRLFLGPGHFISSRGVARVLRCWAIFCTQDGQSLFSERQDDAQALLVLLDHGVVAQVVHDELPLDEIELLHIHWRIMFLEIVDILASLELLHQELQLVANTRHEQRETLL